MPLVVAVLSPAPTWMWPPTSVVPAPMTTLTLPAAPLVATPVFNTMPPLLPWLVVPERKDKKPLTPVVPEFAVLTLNAPLDVTRPYPVINDIKPPVPLVVAVLSPAPTWMWPAASVSPAPINTLKLPPAPPVEAPVFSTIPPLLPLLAVPERKDKKPLTPVVPEFAVLTLNAPLEVTRP